MLLLRRHPLAFTISLLSTLLSMGLAIGPDFGAPHSPSVAVTTATLIAVVWYTFLTYCAVMKGEVARVRVLIHEQMGLRVVQVTLQNASTDRVVSARWRVRVLRDGALLSVVAPPADGMEDYELFPGETRVAAISVPRLRGIGGAAHGPRVQPGEPQDAMFCVEYAYTSDDGDRITPLPIFYALGIAGCHTRRYQQRPAAERAWEEQGGTILPLLTPPTC